MYIYTNENENYKVNYFSIKFLRKPLVFYIRFFRGHWCGISSALTRKLYIHVLKFFSLSSC